LLMYTIKPNIYGSMAAGILGIPVISNISGLGTVFLSNGFASKVARLLYKIALKIPKKVFYQNSYDRELFVSSGLVDMERTDLLPGSGIDTERFKPIDSVGEEKEDIVRFLFVARLLKDKGLLEYVDAARAFIKYDNVECNIMGAFYPGNPTAISENEMQVWEDAGVVHYLGVSDDVPSVMRKHDCIVLPSYREGLSRVLLEAASLEKPIITTDVPGCKEVVDDGINGYLCNVKSVSSLIDKMHKILFLSPTERDEMGKKGRVKVISEFDEKFVIEKYKKALLKIFDYQS